MEERLPYGIGKNDFDLCARRCPIAVEPAH